MSGKHPAEPSMNLVRRLGDLDPSKLVGEVQRLRRERDALRDSLSMKMSAHVAAMGIRPEDVLVVRKPGRLDPTAAAEALVALADRLRQRHGWDGAIVLLDGQDTVRAAVPGDAEALIAKIRAASGEAE